MRYLREWLLRLWGTYSRRRHDDEIAEELRLHLALAAEDAERRGDAPGDAARAAAIAVGGHAQAMEAIRDQRGLPWLEDLWRDVRESLRMLRGHPLFTAVALITLALGIGANTAIFTIVNGVILRPLAYPKPEQLMFLNAYYPQWGSEGLFAPAEYLEFRGLTHSFAHVGAYTTKEVNLTAVDRPLRIRAAFVDANLLRALGVSAAQGRLFETEETEVHQKWFPGSEPPPAAVALVSHELWQYAFGGAPLIGQTIDVDDRRREVIGIMPPGADVGDLRTQVWLPLGLNPATRNFRGYHILSVIGRLRDGITPPVAQREIDALMETYGERVGLKPEDHIFEPAGRTKFSHVAKMTPLQHAILGDANRSIWLLQAAVGLVLLIACSNLANLLLARAETRRREFAVRTALGATGGRLLRQSMTEGVLLSLGGGLLGLGVAHAGVQALVRGFPSSLPRTTDVTIDVVVLLAAFGISVATGLLFGLVPFAHTRVRHLVIALKEGGERGGTGAGRHVVRRGLVVVQVALAVMLVTGAALLVRTVYNLTWVDGGFDRARLVTFSITLGKQAKGPRVQALQRVLATLRGLPGVLAATAMSELPPNQHRFSEDTDIDNYVAPPEGPYESIDFYQSVMTDYFETMGIPIVQGRGFRSTDTVSSGMVAIVNEKLASTYWRGLNPIGQRIRPAWGDWVPWLTVIGVARDVKQDGVDRKAGTELYFFVDQMGKAPSPYGRTPETMHMVLRTTLPPSSLSSAITKAVHDVDPRVPIVRLRDMDSVVIESISRRRLLAQVLSAFAGLALVLAAVGTYGMFSFMVAERRREIGIRMALGAGRSRVLAHVMTQGLQLTIIGVACGLAGAYAANHVIASMLFGVRPTDPRTIAGVIATIVGVAALACWLPAFRASRLDPNDVLRAD